jgi:hypothetical protein
MRFKIISVLALATSLSLANVGAAQRSPQNPPPQSPPASSDPSQQPSANSTAPGQRAFGPGMMTPAMMQMMASMMAAQQDGSGRGPQSFRRPGPRPGEGLGGPLQRVSRLLAVLDDPHVRTALGLTDQQADGLRKIVIDTETFAIKTGADIAVDSIDLRELLRADKPDKAAVMAKGDQISKNTSQMINRFLTATLAAKTILTPEQQKMIRAYMESGAPVLPPPAPPSHP